MKMSKYLMACFFLSIFYFLLKVNIFSGKYIFIEETSVFRDFAETATQQVVVLMANALFLQNKSICCLCIHFGYFFCLQLPPAGFLHYWKILMCGTAQIWYLSLSSAFFFSLQLKAAPFFAQLYIMKMNLFRDTSFLFLLLVKWGYFLRVNFGQRRSIAVTIWHYYSTVVFIFLLNILILFSPSTYFYLPVFHNPIYHVKSLPFTNFLYCQIHNYLFSGTFGL